MPECWAECSSEENGKGTSWKASFCRQGLVSHWKTSIETTVWYTHSWSLCTSQYEFIRTPMFRKVLIGVLFVCFNSSNVLFFFHLFLFSWRLITLQYCSGFCHTLTWISHGFTCIPHPDPPSHLPLHLIPLGLPSAPALSTCLMHPTWADDLFHP